MITSWKNRTITILFLLVLISIVVNLTLVIAKAPSIRVDLTKNASNENIVRIAEPEGQGNQLGIQIGDRILEINGKPVNEFYNFLKYNSLEGAENVLILQNGSVTKFIAFAQQWSSDHSALELLHQLYIPGVSLIIFFAFSAFLYIKRRDDFAVIILILFFIAIGISYYGSAASTLRNPVGNSVIYVVLPNIPLIFMSFMNIYLKRFSSRLIGKGTLRFLYIIVGIMSLASMIYIWTDVFSVEAYRYISTTYVSLIMVSNLICTFTLLTKFLIHRKTKLKSLFTITLLAHLVAFMPFSIFNLLPGMLGVKELFPSAFSALFLFVLPIVYFYLSTSNQLFDIDFIITRFKYYTAISLLPALLLAALVSFVLISNDGSLWSDWIVTFVIVYIGMTLFLYVKEQIDQRFRPGLFKAMYSYQDSLDRFSRNIARVMKHSDLEGVLKQEINDLLPVNRITFLVVDQMEQSIFPMSDNHEEKVTEDFLLGMVDSLKLGELIDLPYGLGLIIGKQRARYHILWIGLKSNHTRYNSDEIRWLKTMANYSSIVFENLYLIEGLIEDLQSEVRKENTASPWVLRMLFCLSENERRKLAADLHDSALQDQLLWYRKLEAIKTDHLISDELGLELDDIKEGLLDVIHQIRETCNELRPPLLKEMGVVEAVESIIEHTQMRVNFEVQFRSHLFNEPLDEEQITAIYRIVQELLRNANKHAAAKLVQLDLELREGTLYFRYQDDGIGMETRHMMESFEHMGLSGIKERVASLEGDISFYSEHGKGLEVIILMPIISSYGRSERGLLRDSYLIS
ncbi:hypothetical protein I6N90_19700 [Paenibacillus sp. GSMTC-2017]|uniref:ATP-binding protein n=1 Tax=Paenibacillus sp. GSMTC-2017 TaxID=2794350 RepID=UPI0018D80671|nr:ATP-binding protein [Paenibacillus sp. GSMTC-2017]MBH5320030.1 hypothetical protein [Paenibacillus sp. GSMTC-2017]